MFVLRRPIIWLHSALLHVVLEDADPKLHRVRLRQIAAHTTLRVECVQGVRDGFLNVILRVVVSFSYSMLRRTLPLATICVSMGFGAIGGKGRWSGRQIPGHAARGSIWRRT